MLRGAFPLLAFVSLLMTAGIGAAVAAEPETDAVVLADVNVFDVKAEQKTPGAVDVTFDIANYGDTQNNVVTRLDLIKVEGSSRITIDSFVEKTPFQVEKGKTVPKTIRYVAPEFASGDFQLLVSLVNVSGMTYAIGNAGTITLSGSGQYALLQSDKCYLSVEGEAGDVKYPLSLGVDIDTAETLLGHCAVKNLADHDLNAKLAFDTSWRSAAGKSVETAPVENADVNIAAGATKEITFRIPTTTVAQAYNVVVSLVDEKGAKASNDVIAHYVVRGVSATIQQAQYSIDASAATVSFDWTPSADSHFQARKRSFDTNTYYAQVNGELNGAVCATSDKLAVDAANPKHEIVKLPLTGACTNPTLRLTLTDASGTVLDERIMNESAQGGVAARTNLVSSVLSGPSSILVAALKIFGALTVLLIVLIMAWKFRRKSLLFIFFASALFIGGSSAHAMTWGHTYCGIPGDCVTLTMTSNLNKSTYLPGENIVLNYSLVDSLCIDGTFFPASIMFRVFGSTSYDSTDQNADGSAELGDGMQGVPLVMTVPIPANQAPGNYTARVCGRILFEHSHLANSAAWKDSYQCVNMPFTVASPNVNGGWSPWSTTCSATCGGGVLTRTCTNPAPSGTGTPCVGESTQVCNTDPCPELEVCEKIGTEWFHRANGANLNTTRGSAVSLKAFYDTSIGDCAGTEVTNDQNVTWTELSDPSNAFTVTKGGVTTANLTGVNVGDGSMRVSANGQSVNLGLVGFCEATVACSDKESQTCKDQDFTVTDPVCGTTFHCKGTRVCDMNIREVTPGF